MYGCDSEDTIRLPQLAWFEYDPTTKIPWVVPESAIQAAPPFGCQTIAFRRELVQQMGGYDTRLCYGSDHEFIVRACGYGKVGCLPEYLYVFRIQSAAISGAGARIQRRVGKIISDSAGRRVKGEDFSTMELDELAELQRLKKGIPQIPERIKKAYYWTRLGTLYRHNHMPWQSLACSLKAIRCSPGHLFRDRKLVGNLYHVLRGVFFNVPHPGISR
jgi:hypothetical protein